jgi:hypothetical protein
VSGEQSAVIHVRRVGRFRWVAQADSIMDIGPRTVHYAEYGMTRAGAIRKQKRSIKKNARQSAWWHQRESVEVTL